jgi:hypothetical protein
VPQNVILGPRSSDYATGVPGKGAFCAEGAARVTPMREMGSFAGSSDRAQLRGAGRETFATRSRAAPTTQTGSLAGGFLHFPAEPAPSVPQFSHSCSLDTKTGSLREAAVSPGRGGGGGLADPLPVQLCPEVVPVAGAASL